MRGPNKEEWMKRVFRRPSPAMIVAIVALIAALGGSAIAGGVLTKKKVNKIITNRAPGLSVAHAKTADSATSATNASNAAVAQSPVAWAHIAANGDLLGSSSNITQANEDNPFADGEYCFKGLTFAFKSLQATLDSNGASHADDVARVGIPQAIDCKAGTGFSGAQAGVNVISNAGSTSFDPAVVWVWFFN
jgi:hypothetical protein